MSSVRRNDHQRDDGSDRASISTSKGLSTWHDDSGTCGKLHATEKIGLLGRKFVLRQNTCVAQFGELLDLVRQAGSRRRREAGGRMSGGDVILDVLTNSVKSRTVGTSGRSQRSRQWSRPSGRLAYP